MKQNVQKKLSRLPRLASLQAQRGFLVPLSIILIVGIAIMAFTISRISSQTNHSSVFEGLSLQTFYAAESGAQYGLNQVLFDVSQRTTADANCAVLNTAVYLDFDQEGLNTCGTLVSCSCDGACDGSGTISYYTVTSAARCGDFDADASGNVTREGNLVSERTVAVTAYM